MYNPKTLGTEILEAVVRSFIFISAFPKSDPSPALSAFLPFKLPFSFHIAGERIPENFFLELFHFQTFFDISAFPY